MDWISTVAGKLGLAGGGGTPLRIGEPGPTPSDVVDQDGAPVSFHEAYESGPVFVYFYWKASTPVCTAHSCQLRDDFEILEEMGVQVFGVSPDGSAAQKKFQVKNGLPFRLIADVEGKVAAAFRVPTVFKMPARRAFLIRNGRVIWAGAAGPKGFEQMSALL